MARVAVRSFVFVGLLYAGIVMFFSCAENSFIFFPDFPSRNLSPVGIPHEDVQLETTDGVRVHGWLFLSPDSGAPWMIMFHGNAGNISGRGDYYDGILNLGLNILAIDYRGYGRSEGKPNEKGLYLDALASYDYLRSNLGVDSTNMVVFGHSLGSAVAVYLSTERPVAALIIEGALTSVADLGQEIYPFLPVRWIVKNRFDSFSRIDRVRCPVLFLHAEEDEVIPVRHGRRLFERTPSPKEFVSLINRHNDAVLDPQYFMSVRQFLKKHDLIEE